MVNKLIDCVRTFKTKRNKNGDYVLAPISTVSFYDAKNPSVPSWSMHSLMSQLESLQFEGVERKEELQSQTKLNNRCKYCGCLTSSFDIHCASCGAPL